jgi:hypothetical protein
MRGSHNRMWDSSSTSAPHTKEGLLDGRDSRLLLGIPNLPALPAIEARRRESGSSLTDVGLRTEPSPAGSQPRTSQGRRASGRPRLDAPGAAILSEVRQSIAIAVAPFD